MRTTLACKPHAWPAHIKCALVVGCYVVASIQAGAFKVTTHLGAFGCPLSKPLQLWGNVRFLQVLYRMAPEQKLSEEAKSHYYIRAWDGKITGQPGLAESAAYTPDFARCILQAYVRSLPLMRVEKWLTPWDDGEDSSSSVELDQ